MDVFKRSFPIIAIIIFQLLILALTNLSYNVPTNAFKTGTINSLLLPVNSILILLAFSSIVVIYNAFKNIEEEIETHLRLENQEQLKELLKTMRGQRHDFNHHIQTIYGFLSVNAYDEAKTYLEESMSQISVTNEIIRSDNPGLNALLYVKSGQMERHGIYFAINVKTSAKLPLRTSELNAIVGNLLDNAIQKLIQTPVENARIKLELYQHDRKLVLEIIDNGPLLNPLYSDKIFLPGFTTKEKGEGLGLFNVKQIVEKYDGDIQVQSKDGLTIFKIFLPFQKGSSHEHS